MFDIDHTLIFAIDKRLHPWLNEDPRVKNNVNIYTIDLSKSISPKNFTQFFAINSIAGCSMWVIVRYGVMEMLEYLSTFCEFFVYSHGFKEYIMAILEQIDPNEKYFKNRDYTVVAPRD